MTPKQILDSFSETLVQDERILSAQERALLTAILQHAQAATGEDANNVETVIAAAVGETVAQRAFAVLGSSIVERILEQARGTASHAESQTEERLGSPGPGPKPPGPDPEPPGVKAPRKEPHKPVRSPGPGPAPGPDPEPPGVKAPHKAPLKPMGDPEPPGKDPEPPGADTGPGVKFPAKPGRRQETRVASASSVATVERPEKLPARCVILDEFLAPQELEQLTRFALENESEFRESVVISRTDGEGVIDCDHRRSQVLMELGENENLMLARINAVLPSILDQLGMEDFSIDHAEVQMTASNDGDFFRFHSDNSSTRVKSRTLTFVYFFHREPCPFEGGELRIHDARLENGVYVSEGSYQTIVPRQNQVVFFPCELLHEITAVKCPSGQFADSRFTVNGWLHR